MHFKSLHFFIVVRLLLPKSYYMDVPAEPWKFEFLYINFSSNCPPFSIPFLIQNYPILPKLGALTIICSKYTQFLNFGSFISVENLQITIPNFAKYKTKQKQKQKQKKIKTTSKGRHIICIPCHCESHLASCNRNIALHTLKTC